MVSLKNNNNKKKTVVHDALQVKSEEVREHERYL